jgi:hypothetical protein
VSRPPASTSMPDDAARPAASRPPGIGHRRAGAGTRARQRRSCGARPGPAHGALRADPARSEQVADRGGGGCPANGSV